MLKASVKAFHYPTETPEADGTLEWNATTLVTVELTDAETSGLGYTYADVATAHFIVEHALPELRNKTAEDHHLVIKQIKRKVRNLGNAGVSSMALSALDTAFWDLRAKKARLSVQDLLGRKRSSVPFYGSGLFINNTESELETQIKKFSSLGMKSFKMKIGGGIEDDLRRVNIVRALIGKEASLFVDANGAYDQKESLALAFELSDLGVTWFEEPITSDDENGMKYLREHFPASMNYVAGEYCNQNSDFLHYLQFGLVDIIQTDATRSEGVSGTIEAAHLAHAFKIPLSTHCAPLLHGNVGICLDELMIAEGFYDHLRVEEKLFLSEGKYADGKFEPSKDQKGFGWSLSPDAKGYMTYEYAI